MLLGLVMFYLWFESLTKWLNAGDTKEARWVLTPLLVFLVGAGLAFAAALPARAEERNNPTLRRFIYGSNFALTALLLLFALVVGNVFLGLRLPNRLDTTESGFYTLGDDTKRFLATLDQPVKVYSTLTDLDRAVANRVSNDTRRLLEAARDANPAKFQVRQIDPVLNKDEIKSLQARFPQFDLNTLGVLIAVGEDEKRASFVRFNDLYSQESAGGFGSEPTITFQGEAKILGEVRFLAESSAKPVVYFTQGSGELEVAPASAAAPGAVTARGRPATQLKAILEKNYVDVRPWRPEAADPKVPDDATAVVVADPRSPIPAEVAAAIQAYMSPTKPDAKKGKLILLSSPFPGVNQKGVSDTGLEGLLTELQVTLGKAYLIGQPYRGLGYSEVHALPNEDLLNAGNPLASAFIRGVVLSDCRPVMAAETPPGGPPAKYRAEWFLAADRGNQIVWFDPDPPDNPGATLSQMVRDPELLRKYRAMRGVQIPVAAIVSEGTTPRAVVVGSGAAFADPTRRAGPADEPPVDLVAAALDWLRDRPTLGAVNKTYGRYTPSRAADSMRLFWLPFGLTLLGIAAVGAGVWVVRRK
jgi:hypothetical protein